MDKFIIVVGLTILAGLTIIVIGKGITKNEKVECLKWDKYQSEYPNFYSTDWQKAQCKQFNINLK